MDTAQRQRLCARQLTRMFSIPYLDLPPLQAAAGTVVLPGSKSISNRVLLLAALSSGTTHIHDLLDSDDTRVMLDALKALGCEVVRQPEGGSVSVSGLGGALPVRQAKLFLGNAGTAMRPLTAALSLLASVWGGEFEVRGIARMHERPIGDLVDALRQMGCPIADLGQPGYPPLRLGNGQPAALLLHEPLRVRGDVSSQFLTALLLALPLVAEQDIHIDVVGELISKPYIEITLRLLAQFGVHIRRDGWSRFTVPAGSRYQSPGSIHVEGDASSASYFIALGAIAAGGAEGITVQGVGLDSIQGDIRFVEAARAMGADISGSANALHVRRGSWPLKAIDLDCNHIPDAAMTLAVMALYANGTTTLRNIASWRVKETDRIAAMVAELQKLGATVQWGEDFLSVTPPATLADWRSAAIHTYDDHRIAMCFSLAAFNPAGIPVRILDPRCVGKTFPDYFEALFALTATASAYIPVLCVDGPTASGKGTLSAALAERLGYHLLDSGALYRLVGLAAERAGVDTSVEALSTPEGAQRVSAMAAAMNVTFLPGQILLEGTDVTDAVRTESAGMAASRVSAVPGVRQALLELQHRSRRLPGLVADGRDMGTVIFPAATLKVFLTASAETRAERRYKQLISKGNPAKLEDLLLDLKARDERDSQRALAPLKPAKDALLLDNSAQTIEESVAQVLDWWEAKRPFHGVVS